MCEREFKSYTSACWADSSGSASDNVRPFAVNFGTTCKSGTS